MANCIGNIAVCYLLLINPSCDLDGHIIEWSRKVTSVIISRGIPLSFVARNDKNSYTPSELTNHTTRMEIGREGMRNKAQSAMMALVFTSLD